jgi:hemerythrin-like metal-binding protein
MPQLIWTRDLSVNVRVLDEDHKQLFGLINELQGAIKAGHSRAVLESVLDRLMEYTKIHLAREEEFLVQTGYRIAAAHAEEHCRMVQRVRDIRGRFNDGSVAMLSLELRAFLQNWWTVHIQSSDSKYKSWLNAKGVF